MYKGIIFDLDGTLLNTIDDLADAGNQALSELGYLTHKTNEYKMLVGNGIPKLIERMLPKGSSEEEQKRAFFIFSKYYEMNKENKTRPYDGMQDLIQKMHEAGIKTAVATNKSHEYSCELVEKFFGKNIDIVVGQREGIPCKPDTAVIEVIFRHFMLPKSEIIYVGDSGVDMQTAENAGLISCGVLWGFRSREELVENGAVHLADNPASLLRIIRNGE